MKELNSIKSFIEQIQTMEIVLPALQRNFVWKPQQIELLFDSIMRRYPIGTVLLWKVQAKDEHPRYDLRLYKFNYDYHELNSKKLQTPYPLEKDQVYVTLDGQQRLTALYIGLRGSYSYRKKGARKDNPSSYPLRELYLNLLNEKDPVETGYVYEFRFLTEGDAKKQQGKQALWYKVKNSYVLKTPGEVTKEVSSILSTIDDGECKQQASTHQAELIDTLVNLHYAINELEIVHQVISDKDSEDILEIFVRINNGGTPLTKTDLLLSTMVLYWESAKDKFDSLVTELNNIGRKFKFTNDVVMKTCLAAIDKTVVFNIKVFNKETVEKIEKEWDSIRRAMISTGNLLNEFGYNRDNIKAYNATIPIAYFLHNNKDISASEKENIRKYFALATLKRIFGGSSDNTINSMIKILRNTNSFASVMKDSNFEDQFTVTDKFLEELVNEEKGEYSFVILTLLYPNNKYHQQSFHQDHIHPRAKFKDKILEENDVAEEKWEDWKKKKDLLPNIQMLEGTENKEKQDLYLRDWLKRVNKPESRFKEQNYISENTSLEFVNFEKFFEDRKSKIKDKLREILCGF